MTDLARELESLVPPFDESGADWGDVLRRGRTPRRWPAALAAAALIAGVLAATSLGTAIGADAFDRLSSWVSGAPGEPASEEQVEALKQENARSLAPIPSETELGLLERRTFRGVEFELLGFRDRGSLCLRLRAPGAAARRILQAPVTCVSEDLLVDLGKPVAVFSATDPFPSRARTGLQALYGLAADRVATVELTTEAGLRRVEVRHNSFLYLYEGDPPRLTDNRLDYRSDVPSRARALDVAGRSVGSVAITSLKRGFPAAPEAAELPGPARIERRVPATVEWLESGALRGEPYGGSFGSIMRNPRLFRPNPATSLRVLVARGAHSGGELNCITAISPLEGSERGVLCAPLKGAGPGLIAYGIANRSFDDQHPVHYGLVADEVRSLEIILRNGKRRPVPLIDNVFAQQSWNAEAAKLVGYDAVGQVVLVQVLAY
jgi:hypothetical protein